LGLVATCNAGGAGKWRPEYVEHFRGRRVVVLPDQSGDACDVCAALKCDRSLFDACEFSRGMRLDLRIDREDTIDVRCCAA
jgi:hypothetical protein